MNEIEVGAGPLWTLVPLSVLAGFTMMFVFRRYSDRNAIRETRNRILAHLMEFALFIDEPLVVMRANRDLARENWCLFRLLLRPLMILTAFFIAVMGQMDALYGRVPLGIGDPAVVTVQLKNVSGGAMPRLALKAPAAIAIETPGMRIVTQNQISWRIRALEPVSGDLIVIGPNRSATKTITAGPGVHQLSERRVSSLTTFLFHPIERPLLDPVFAWIEIGYSSATILHWHWLVWFVLISMGTAIVIYGMLATKRVLA